ncbi:phospholipid methyltransferase, partial [Salmonella enterica subsp. enterica]|nr:phospholipid methyltransferase [Salmonella enterica subsp. enterica serovar Enteritidis]
MFSTPQHFMFLRQWVSNPKMVGAVLPSGMSLARLMTKAINQT